MTRYAYYDESGIWETGDSPEDAIERFLSDARATRDEIEGEMLTAPMTDRLTAMVDKYGYNVASPDYSWRILPDGTLDLDTLDVVAVGDIATMSGYPVATVNQWQQRGLLPSPAATTSGGSVWWRAEIQAWLESTGRIK